MSWYNGLGAHFSTSYKIRKEWLKRYFICPKNILTITTLVLLEEFASNFTIHHAHFINE